VKAFARDHAESLHPRGAEWAGKTTYARRFLPQEMCCHEFVNADLIAAGLSPFNPAEAEVEAGQIMVQRLKLLRTERKDFSFETTLSSYGYVTMLEEMRAAGYRIRLDFLWVRDLETSRLRVRSRVVKGGHNIPDDVQVRRFGKGIRLLLEHYRPLIHYWRIFDNTGSEPRLVVEEEDGVLRVVDALSLALIERDTSVRVMPDIPPTAVEESIAFAPGEETRRAMRAMRRAYADVVLENLAWGLPVIQWREGRGTVEVPAEQLEPFARRILEVNGDPLPEEETRELLKGLKV
jgi:predicted ABC-type ATPase